MWQCCIFFWSYAVSSTMLCASKWSKKSRRRLEIKVRSHRRWPPDPPQRLPCIQAKYGRSTGNRKVKPSWIFTFGFGIFFKAFICFLIYFFYHISLFSGVTTISLTTEALSQQTMYVSNCAVLWTVSILSGRRQILLPKITMLIFERLFVQDFLCT